VVNDGAIAEIVFDHGTWRHRRTTVDRSSRRSDERVGLALKGRVRQL
jgi:hypothetical protein